MIQPVGPPITISVRNIGMLGFVVSILAFLNLTRFSFASSILLTFVSVCLSGWFAWLAYVKHKHDDELEQLHIV
jgi:hypothetical protein